MMSSVANATIASGSSSDLTQPQPPFSDTSRERDPLPLPRSRPLSEISDNSVKFNRRTSSTLNKSRPNSEVREDVNGQKRVSSINGLEGIRTITLNLNDYATAAAMKSPTSTSSAASTSNNAPPPPSPTTKPQRPSLPPRKSTAGQEKKTEQEEDKLAGENGRTEEPHVSPLLVAKRLSLRPSPLSASYADVTKPSQSPPPSASSSTNSSMSDPAASSKPATKAKPSWLRRASGNNALKSKSKTPPPKENSPSIPTSASMSSLTSLAPALPPRKGRVLEDVPEMSLPENPRRSSYANVAAGPSRSRLADGEGQPAFSSAPPPIPSRENIGNLRNRLAAWTQAAQGSSSSFSRSESTNSLASYSSQRVPISAQRVLGHAGSAVQKGWAGLRSKGVGGSISSMSAVGGPSRKSGLEPSGSWSAGLNRSSKDRILGENVDLRAPMDGPVFEEGVVKRAAGFKTGRVFGRELREVAKAWGVEGANETVNDLSEFEQRRRASLPAIVVRTVEYLEIWGPKEEGIFRISGRTSHLSRLRKEFDAGADIDLRQCHPADLDPHAVAGTFKSYLRELPSPLLTNELIPEFDAHLKNRAGNRKDKDGDKELARLLGRLPISHWFLLADIVKLLTLIPKHVNDNRMTLNALMLSLGPSLNISGGVITELLERREELFKDPPSLPQDAIDLIDFGDVDIEPPVMPELATDSRSVTPISQRSVESSSLAKTRPNLPKKPSLSRLLAVSTGSKTASRTASTETLQSSTSIVGVAPPRVEVAFEQTSPLPTFEISMPFVAPKGGPETTTIDMEQLKDRDSLVVIEPERRPSWTDSEPATPTPIADRFSSIGSNFPSLWATRSASDTTTPTIATIPLVLSDSLPSSTIKRRPGGSSAFFSASLASANERQRSLSKKSSISSSLKRRDEDGDVVKNGDIEEDRAKELSAGPEVSGR